jgi:putative (di)nucleoside polyphosphate hydrolase
MNRSSVPGAEPDSTLYRPCVGLMLFNPAGQVFVGRRIDTASAWQMPQGGIDPGEDPRVAALRELKEEIGTDNAVILAESTRWRRYDLPQRLWGRVWGGRYRGQTQRWFALRFTGTDADIDLGTHHPEFDAWRWVAIDELPQLVVPFKREVYMDVIAEFRHMIGSIGAPEPGTAQS